MAKAIYNIEKLGESGEIDVKTVSENFTDIRAYFKELDIFMEKSKQYLRSYNPTLVIYSEDIRKEFLDELEEVTGIFFRLGMSGLVSVISELGNAARGGVPKILSDGLLVFYAKVDVVRKLIGSVQMTEKAREMPLILAVDDKPELLTSIVNMLEGSFRVIAVTSGAAALKALEKHTPHLLLLDIEMPQMNGHQLMKAIREHKNFKETPIIFLTGKSERRAVMEAFKNGGNDYILKPVNKELLFEKIEKQLRYAGSA